VLLLVPAGVACCCCWYCKRLLLLLLVLPLLLALLLLLVAALLLLLVLLLLLLLLPTCGELVEHQHLEARLAAALDQEQRALNVLALLQGEEVKAATNLSWGTRQSASYQPRVCCAVCIIQGNAHAAHQAECLGCRHC
jgi:hypothetical protein